MFWHYCLYAPHFIPPFAYFESSSYMNMNMITPLNAEPAHGKEIGVLEAHTTAALPAFLICSWSRKANY